jgi:hypothetical protein
MKPEVKPEKNTNKPEKSRTMKRFLDYLAEAVSLDDDLLGHLTHAKDIPHESPGHSNVAVSLIRSFHNLRQGKQSGVSASMKHDGGASVHIVHDKDGRVGVSDKHRFARGVVAYSDEEIDHHFGKHPGYAQSLKHLRSHGHEIVGKGHHVQGDILYTPDDPTHDHKGSKVDYTPNRITYHAKTSAPVGIAIHTEITNGVAHALSKNAVKSSSNIFVPREDFKPAEHHYGDKHQKAVEYHLDQAEKLLADHTTDHLTPDHINHLTIYHNRVARGSRKPSLEGYTKYLRSRGAEESKKLKTEKGQQKTKAAYESLASHAEQNSEHFNRSIQIRHHLQAATDHVLHGVEHSDLKTSIDGKKSMGEGIVLQRKDAQGNSRPVAKLVHSTVQHALGNNPRFPNKGSINESKNQSSGVLVVGKIRYATLGHKKMVNQAKSIASKVKGKLHIHLTGSADPLTPEQKKTHAEAMFEHPVESTANVLDSLSRLNGHHHTLHIVAGSDRADEYRKIAEKYNGKPDKQGNVPFHFPGGVHVHEVEGKREDIDKHPTKMTRDELERSASATKVVGLAKSGDYAGFKAYHPDMHEKIIKDNYSTIRSQASNQNSNITAIKKKLKESVIFEKVLNIGLNPDHEKFREAHRHEIHDILRNSYSNMGGYSGLGSGTKEESDSIHADISNNSIKAVKRNGKVVSAVVYKNARGRKTIALGTDRSEQGKKDAAMIMKDDMKHKRAWGEFSGALKHIYGEKLGAPKHPSSKASEILGKK